MVSWLLLWIPELALDPLSVGPGPCFEISKAHLLSFPDVLFPSSPVTHFPSLPPGCPKSLVITPHPGLSLQEVPLVSDLPLARVCLLPRPTKLFSQDLSNGRLGIKLILLTALTLCYVLNCVPQNDILKL